MNDADKLRDIQNRLRAISSELGLLKGNFEDDDNLDASDATETAQDRVDDAIDAIGKVF